jgi:hypothetical protein
MTIRTGFAARGRGARSRMAPGAVAQENSRRMRTRTTRSSGHAVRELARPLSDATCAMPSCTRSNLRHAARTRRLRVAAAVPANAAGAQRLLTADAFAAAGFDIVRMSRRTQRRRPGVREATAERRRGQEASRGRLRPGGRHLRCLGDRHGRRAPRGDHHRRHARTRGRRFRSCALLEMALAECGRTMPGSQGRIGTGSLRPPAGPRRPSTPTLVD